jgi:hypothetical protein
MSVSTMIGNYGGGQMYDSSTGNYYMGPIGNQQAIAQSAGAAAAGFVQGFGTPWQTVPTYMQQPQMYDPMYIDSYMSQIPQGYGYGGVGASATAYGGGSAYAAAYGGYGGYPQQPQYPQMPQIPMFPEMGYPQQPQYPSYPQYPQMPQYPQYPQYPTSQYPPQPQYPSYPTYPPSYPQAPVAAPPAVDPYSMSALSSYLQSLFSSLLPVAAPVPAPPPPPIYPPVTAAPPAVAGLEQLLAQLLGGLQPAAATPAIDPLESLLSQLLGGLGNNPISSLIPPSSIELPNWSIGTPTSTATGDPHFGVKIKNNAGELVDLNFDYQGIMNPNEEQWDRGYDNGVSKINLKLAGGPEKWDYDGDGTKESAVSVFSAVSGKVGDKVFSYDVETNKLQMKDAAGNMVDVDESKITNGNVIKFEKTGVIGADGKEATGFLMRNDKGDLVINTGDREITATRDANDAKWHGKRYLNMMTKVTTAGRHAVKSPNGKAYAPSGLLAMHEDMSYDKALAFFKTNANRKQDKLNADIAAAFKVGNAMDFEGRKKLADQPDTVDYAWGLDANLTGGATGAQG